MINEFCGANLAGMRILIFMFCHATLLKFMVNVLFRSILYFCIHFKKKEKEKERMVRPLGPAILLGLFTMRSYPPSSV